MQQIVKPIAANHSIERHGDDELLKKLRDYRQKEMIFAVVGYAGSGTSQIADMLKPHIETNFKDYKVHKISARAVLDKYAHTIKKIKPDGASPIDMTRWYQGIGDAMRQTKSGHNAVAAYMTREIKICRDTNKDGHNIFILDSLKHPQEVDLLRHIYGLGFCLIGVGCRPDVREKRLSAKFKIFNVENPDLRKFINRDAEDSEFKHGQQVDDTFHRADYFIDNTVEHTDPDRYLVPDEIKRLCEIVLTNTIHRPRSDERGMYHASAASMRSSCLSRQVGAAILDSDSNLIAVGANEVPKATGGAYDETHPKDDRCFKQRKECSNTVVQNEIVKDIHERLKDKHLKPEVTVQTLGDALKKTRVKSLIEFSRSVHAEMDALLCLVRTGTRLPPDSVLYSTTYPCHNCARHIVAAGIARVVYLEPYSKSMAIDLHNDAIADNQPEKESAGKVKFSPYQGVSPRLYKAVYLKSTDLKDKQTGKLFDNPGNYREAVAIWSKTSIEFEKEIMTFIEKEIESQAGDQHV